MEMKKVSELRAHPQNEYFFDDIQGADWDTFIDSIRIRLENGQQGIMHPILITEDGCIVSGRQRYRAYEHLGIDEIEVEVKHYESDDDILKDLIEANLRQRGKMKNQLKFGRCIKALEKIYGIYKGRHTNKNPHCGGSTKLQKLLIEELNTSEETYRRSKKLSDLPEEYQQMILDKNITARAASNILARMSQEELHKLIPMVPAIKKYTEKELQNIVDDMHLQIQEMDDKIAVLEVEKEELVNSDKAYSDLLEKHEKLEAQQRKTYESLQTKIKETEALKKNITESALVKENIKTLKFVGDMLSEYSKTLLDVAEYMKTEDRNKVKDILGRIEDMAADSSEKFSKLRGSGKIVAIK